MCLQETGGIVSFIMNRYRPMITRTNQTPKLIASSAADDPRWARVVARDKTADDLFWYSVSTTGVVQRELVRIG